MAGFKERNVNCTKNIADWDHSVRSSVYQIGKLMSIQDERTYRSKFMYHMPAYNCNFNLKGEKVKAYV